MDSAQRMREIYAERLSVLRDSAALHLAGLLELSEAQAGLHAIGWLRDGISGNRAPIAAAEHDVEVTPLSRRCRELSVPEGLQLGFAPVDTSEIRGAVQQLARALESLQGKGRARRAVT